MYVYIKKGCTEKADLISITNKKTKVFWANNKPLSPSAILICRRGLQEMKITEKNTINWR